MREIEPFYKEDDENILAVMDNYDTTGRYPICIDINNFAVQLSELEATNLIDTIIEILNQKKYKN